ncbi:MocR-like pyridoxine biosynthesis transcription factor PdxR [Brevibacillus fluminis]|uniref:MocR-like pyridoxine biosynthesis transcription factor PdxR n=1 Tax=Brevibacillus fluminis TaxID=511487 RepID=UPI003F8A0A6D
MGRDGQPAEGQLPKYQQIIAYIKEKIANGEWPIGSKIPSQRTLASQFKVNRSTIITAIEELTADGLIEGQMGKGTVVVNNTWTLLATNPPPDWNAYVTSGVHKPSQDTVQKINQDEFDASLIQLSKGELSPEIFPLVTMQRLMHKVTDELHAFGYEEPKGYGPLRQAVSDYVRSFGIEASPSSILIVSGALQALQLISVGLLHRGSTVLLEKPSYLYSLHVFQSAGMKLTSLEMDAQGLLPGGIPALRKQGKADILYTNPCFHNPTGILMSQKRRQELMHACEAERLPVIEDDLYRELWFDEPPPAPLKAMDRHGHVLYLGSLSKTLSPGLRIGWIVGPEPVIERLADIKMQTDYGTSSLSQRVAAEWLTSGEYQKHVAYIREQLRIRKAAMLEALELHASDLAEWESPAGGFFIWLRLKEKVHIHELFSKALRQGVLLNPGSIYGQDRDRYLRLSYAYASLPELRQGIRVLADILKNMAR